MLARELPILGVIAFLGIYSTPMVSNDYIFTHSSTARVGDMDKASQAMALAANDTFGIGNREEQRWQHPSKVRINQKLTKVVEFLKASFSTVKASFWAETENGSAFSSASFLQIQSGL